MKRMILLGCIMVLAQVTFSQTSKWHMGLLVKGGNFTLPHAKSDQSLFIYQDDYNLSYKPGYQYTFGMYGEYCFSPQLSIIAELGYRLSYFEQIETQRYQFFNPNGIIVGNSSLTYKSTSNSLVAPIKLQFSPKKLSKWHFQAGAGVCRNITTKTESITIYRMTGVRDSEGYAEYGANHWEASAFRTHFTTGILYQVSNNTKIGIEYLYEKYYTQEGDSYFNPNPLIDIYYPGTYYPSMHSFSVSLQHNLLH